MANLILACGLWLFGFGNDIGIGEWCFEGVLNSAGEGLGVGEKTTKKKKDK